MEEAAAAQGSSAVLASWPLAFAVTLEVMQHVEQSTAFGSGAYHHVGREDIR